MSLPKQVKW